MSERILKALMQLFAIVADIDGVSNRSRAIVQLFLKQQLSLEQVEEYLKIYDEYLEIHHKISQKKEGKKKRTSLNSVKILRICTQINAELTQKQKVVVLMRLLEYVNSDQQINDQELEFVDTVAESFNISREEFENSMAFITCNENTIPDSPNILLINNNKEPDPKKTNKHIYSDTLEGQLVILTTESVGMYSLRYFGNNELFLNGQLMTSEWTYVLTQGSSIRSSKVTPIYYSDIISQFLSDKSQSRINFTTDQIEFHFKSGAIGLRELNMSEEAGKLIGIMGGSGAGKSTLLNVLNSNNTPSSGKVTINGIDIHREADKIEGVIGYVSQDDLLIEELTVFQNLFYNAKLCFDGMSDGQISKLVLNMLNSLGLEETKDLKVGSPLEKTISGGQRKRLNIALELIREPSVMFVDEPTSGLSSRDSENIMDLLKELALKGKLVFVVIHQPSSEIFKMFDRLLILDVGGYPIYYGNPVDAVIYFKQLVNHVNQESECGECGNVNPEQIFNIIEAKVLDEYGNLTDHRKVTPKEWNAYYQENLEQKPEKDQEIPEVPEVQFNIPNKINQFKVFITRDILSKLTNKQYLLINLLEAPILAVILAYFIKFYDMDASGDSTGYVFFKNENLISYMFMSVVVALFIGLTVSAEEIIRDQKIRKRESFLNLSNGSYLCSKVVIMFTLSAIQTISFILVGNAILGIKDMWVDYWLVLFSTACFANMLGLNISSAFNSAVTIYISIPFLLIPQLLFSGVIVKFEKLNPSITSQSEVPLIGEVMASRWAFEALAVNQFKNNKYTRNFYEFDKERSIAQFKKTYWLSSGIKPKTGFVETFLHKEDRKEEVADALQLLQNEIGKEVKNLPFGFPDLDKLTYERCTPEVIDGLKKFMEKTNSYYNKMYISATDQRDELVSSFIQDESSKAAFALLKNNYENESISDLVTNKNELNKIIEYENEFIQRADPVYLDAEGFRAHFYAPTKKLFGRHYDTFWMNIMVLWIMSALLAITLYADAFKKFLNFIGILLSKLSGNKPF